LTDLGSVPTIVFEKRLLLALDEKWIKLNNNKPLVFDAKINEKNQLVLSATLPTKDDKTNNSTLGETDGSN
jgi:hypothetical protein